MKAAAYTGDGLTVIVCADFDNLSEERRNRQQNQQDD
jgi:hypothetical protein